VKRLLLFIVLILGGLILTGGSPVKRVIDPGNKDIFIRGRLIFKNKDLVPIKFWIQGNDGCYSLIIFEENGTVVSKQLKNISDSVNNVFKDSISSFNTNTIFCGEKRYYVVIDFNNKRIENKRLRETIPFGYRVVKKLQETTGGKIYGYFIIEL